MMPSAYVLINTVIGTEESLLENLRSIDAVHDATIVMGEYDVVATVTCDTIHEIKECINDKVRCLDEIQSTMTLMAV